MTLKLQISTVTNQHEWDSLPHNHWQHTWEYGALQESNGRPATRFAMHKNGQLIGFFQAITYPLYGRRSITYIPYGPVWLGEPSERDYSKLRRVLADYGDERGSICVRLESAHRIDGMVSTPLWAYRTSFHQPRGEAILDIRPSIDTLVAHCSKSTRRNIRKSLEQNLVYRVHSGKDMLNCLDDYISLNHENSVDHGTTTHSRDYFESLFTTLSKNTNNFVASVHTSDGTVLAMNIFTLFGTRALCPFGASNHTAKELGAYYFIKWNSIQELQARNIEEFNWGGIAVGRNDQNLRGLNQFKLGWNAQEKHHGDFHDVVLSPLYWVYLVRSWWSNRHKS